MKLLKNFKGTSLVTVKPLAICSTSFQVKEFLSTPENIECTLSLLSI